MLGNYKLCCEDVQGAQTGRVANLLVEVVGTEVVGHSRLQYLPNHAAPHTALTRRVEC